MIRVDYQRVNANFPAFKHEDGDAGYDLYYIGEEITIKKASSMKQNEDGSVTVDESDVHQLDTNLILRMPLGTYGRITNRSGLAAEGLFVFPGTIDPNYRGVLKVQCIALDKDITLKPGHRPAQLVFEKYIEPMLRESRILTSETERGDKGFGLNSGGYTRTVTVK